MTIEFVEMETPPARGDGDCVASELLFTAGQLVAAAMVLVVVAVAVEVADTMRVVEDFRGGRW